MPKGHPRTHCAVCQKRRDVVGKLSSRGKCISCGNARLVENNRGIAAHTGPFFDNWRRAMAACVGASLLDEQREEA